jgi:hypothetical protein
MRTKELLQLLALPMSLHQGDGNVRTASMALISRTSGGINVAISLSSLRVS